MQYDYYKILEVPRDANLEDIKRAYRNKAKIMHPDINNSPKANEVFALVNEAYDVLTNERKRYLHDIKLNYADATKQEADRKKHYYGSSAKNDSYNNNRSNTNFHYDWNSFGKGAYKEKNDEDYFKQSPVVYNLFFASGMFVGFLIVIVTLVGTWKKFWPAPFILVIVPGYVLIREGWKGMMGKKTMYNKIMRKFKK